MTTDDGSPDGQENGGQLLLAVMMTALGIAAILWLGGVIGG